MEQTLDGTSIPDLTSIFLIKVLDILNRNDKMDGTIWNEKSPNCIAFPDDVPDHADTESENNTETV